MCQLRQYFFLETFPEIPKNRFPDGPVIEMTYFNITPHYNCLLFGLLHGGGILDYSIEDAEPDIRLGS